MLFQTPGFVTVEDIANRALQHCGGNRIASITEISKNAKEVQACYTKLRQAELRRNNWIFAIRHNVLRPVDVSSMFWTPPIWDVGTTYSVGHVVSYTDGFGDSRLWESTIPGNLGNIPGSNGEWDNYFGQIVIQPFTVGTSYFAGDLVYEVQTDATFKIYRSLLNGNTDDPNITEAWDATIVYKINDVVSVSSINYISLVDDNVNKSPPSSATQWAVTSLVGSYKWADIGIGTWYLDAFRVLYPLQSGPSSQTQTKNIFPLPYGYLRRCHQSPKSGASSFFGAPTSLLYTDWIIENGFIITREGDPIVLRYTADVTNVPIMDPMFCEGFAARIALEVCEIITQSTEKIRTISTEYQKFMTEARMVNGIENEAEEAPQDDYLAARY